MEDGVEPVFVAPKSGPIPSPSFPTPLERRSPGEALPSQPIWVFDDADPTQREGADTPAPEGLEGTDPPAPEGAVSPGRQSEKIAKPELSLSKILPYHNYDPTAPDGIGEVCTPDSDPTKCPPMPDIQPLVPFAGRDFAEIQVAWEPSNLFSNPLYFEDASLERYGHTHACVVQPFVSLGKFSAQFIGLPYQMALHPIHERRYALGWYRPGECAPYKYYLPPWNAKAALTAGAAYTGLVFLIP